MEPPVSASPAVGDLDGDGAEDVVAADSKGNIVALTGDGAVLWTALVPAGVVGDSCPAIADLDDDGRPEILVGDTSGTLSCLDNNGRVRWQFTGDGTQMGPVLVADIYNCPGREIVVTSHDCHVYLLDANGAWLWDKHFPKDLFPNSTPLLADVDGDGVPELYVGGGLNHLYGIDLATREVIVDINTFMHVNSALAASDLDRDGKDEVVFSMKSGGLWCLSADGIAWQQEFTESGISCLSKHCRCRRRSGTRGHPAFIARRPSRSLTPTEPCCLTQQRDVPSLLGRWREILTAMACSNWSLRDPAGLFQQRRDDLDRTGCTFPR